MKLKKLYIDNYGIFKNQLIENIQDNFIVIGGLNRAGKSTFFNIIRQLGYGFKKNDYALCKKTKIECSGIYEGRKFNLDISGQKKPQVIFNDTLKEIGVEKLYNDIDYFTYKELFTISLSELYKEFLKDNKEAQKLQSIFLGAGLKDVISLPKITNELRNEGEKIGGKTGRGNTKQFKVYNQGILNALKLKQEAKEHLKEYENYLEELNNINKDIKEILKKINNETVQVQRLEFLIDNFDLYNEVINRNIELTQHKAVNILNSYSIEKIEKGRLLVQKYNDSIEMISKNKQLININYKYSKESIDFLANSKCEILECSNKIYSLENTIDYYFNFKETNNGVEKEIRENLCFLNSDLDKNINWIKESKWDEIYKKDLFTTINEYNEKMKILDCLKKDINDLEFKCKLINKGIKFDDNNKNSIKEIKNYSVFMIIFIVLGFLISFINKTLGILVSFGGIVGAAFIFGEKYINKNNKSVKNNMPIYISDIYGEIENKKKEISREENLIKNLKLKLERYKSELRINKYTYYDNLKDYFDSLYSIKRELIRLYIERDKEKEIFNKIKNNLIETNEFIKKVVNIDVIKNQILEKNLYENHSKFENIISDLLRCNSISITILQCKNNKDLIQNKLKKLLNVKENITHEQFLTILDRFLLESKMYGKLTKIKSQQDIAKNCLVNRFKNEKIRLLFIEKIKDNMEITGDNIVDIVDNIYNSYISRQEIQDNIDNLKINLDKNNYALERLKENQQRVKTKLDILSTEEITFLAQQELNKQKYYLKLLAEKYAVYNCAAFMLDNIQNKFIKNTKKNILSGASEIFKYITSKKYKEIKVGDNLLNPDFKTVDSSGLTNSTSSILSRGTREQLFLSVRMSRINDISSDLPIVIDDSLVNFDKRHLINTINILKELSNTHQIFFLTCHSYIVDIIKNVMGDKAQYFKLKEGKFFDSNYKALEMYLSCKSK